MLRIVLDTVVFVRSLINPQSRWGRAVFIHQHQYRLFLSQPVILEILDVLHRPELTDKFRSLKGMDMARIIDILGQAEIVEVPATPAAVSRDVKDDKFLAAARAAGAEYLITEDEDLLVIGEYEGVRIIDTATFLGTLE